jgi:hypothetical protein
MGELYPRAVSIVSIPDQSDATGTLRDRALKDAAQSCAQTIQRGCQERKILGRPGPGGLHLLRSPTPQRSVRFAGAGRDSDILKIGSSIIIRAVARRSPSFARIAFNARTFRRAAARRDLGAWLPFLDTYRTMCLAPQPVFRRVLEDVRAMQLAA